MTHDHETLEPEHKAVYGDEPTRMSVLRCVELLLNNLDTYSLNVTLESGW